MFKTAIFLLAMIFSQTSMADKNTFDRYTYWSLLTSGDVELIRLGARGIGRERIADPMILDVAAAVLWDLRSNHYNADYSDALSWLAKDLGFANSRRYEMFLLRCQQEFGRNEKLTKYVDETLSTVRRYGVADSFNVESVDLNAIRSQLHTIRQTYTASDDNTSAPLVDNQSSLYDVYQKYGVAASFDVSLRGESVPGLVHWDVSYLRVWYPTIGGFRFSFDKEESKGWRLMDQWPIVTAVPLHYSGSDIGLAYAMWTTDPMRLRETYRRLYQQRVTNTVTLDLIADRLWLFLREPQTELSDALSWGCNVLKQSRNGRYAAVLRDVATMSQDKKLARYAQNALDDLKGSAPDSIYLPREQLKPQQIPVN